MPTRFTITITTDTGSQISTEVDDMTPCTNHSPDLPGGDHDVFFYHIMATSESPRDGKAILDYMDGKQQTNRKLRLLQFLNFWTQVNVEVHTVPPALFARDSTVKWSAENTASLNTTTCSVCRIVIMSVSGPDAGPKTVNVKTATVNHSCP